MQREAARATRDPIYTAAAGAIGGGYFLMRGFASRIVWAVTFAFAALLAVAAVSLAHVERTAYWPNPGPDTSSKPAAGGKVPTARSLASTLDAKPAGNTRVVCQTG